jgi:hypothetical protein
MLGFGKEREGPSRNVDTFLTLVIALGGIATGIGAIWTAMLARRQLDEQRRFLEEQLEIARRQAQATEQSLGEQNERAREENERARLSFEVDMALKLEDRWDSPTFRHRRSKSAEHVKEHFFAEDGRAAGSGTHGNFVNHPQTHPLSRSSQYDSANAAPHSYRLVSWPRGSKWYACTCGNKSEGH